MDGLRAAFHTLHYAQGSVLAEGISVPVPRNALRVTAAESAQTGLHAEYFNAPSFDLPPVLSIRVEKVDLDLNRVGPAPEITTKQFAARWSGYLVPPAAGDYSLRVNVERCWDCTKHDQFWLIVDGNPVVVNDGSQTAPDRATVHFSSTSPHSLRLELLHSGEDEGIALEWEPPASALIEEAIHAAQQSDVIVAFVGLSPDLEGEALQLHVPGFAGGDRTSLDLPASQRRLLDRLAGLHKPLVVLLTSGSAIVPGPETNGASAILEAWYPGEEGGHAVANLLSGTANPSGRLPVTFYRSAADLPPFTDYSMAHRTYRYFDGPVLYPFGFGLSYSRFRYSTPRLSSKSVAPGVPLTVTVRVKNLSDMAGTDVAELYLQPPRMPGAPRLALRAFQRVALRASESRELTFTLTPKQMTFADPAGVEWMHPGTYRVFVGGGQPEPGAKGVSFQVVAQ